MIDGRAIASAVAGFVIAAFVSGFAIGVAAATVLPAVWRWVKPLIHGWTA